MQEALAAIPLDFFRNLRQKNYDKAWKLLSTYSQRLFVETLYKSLKPGACSLERLQTDFESGKGWAESYWSQFTQHLQLDHWLSQNYKEYGVSHQQALVRATPSNALLLVIQEEKGWRFGYFETFLDNY
ncbi:hypothetical protein COW36_00905 [bacterium (Candidatus Blackallbacteria) CG17_big_fil_post_rev_8_21_14_2_50_48_46]|uniref:Uncharacterized protein n=1 Tax=bacterium (Candidatus Blackallbacteria) CG17_big_fil_post_rev_8_21_14_2_50_48_46 TaxID=2014261 RepID=A0A2M7GB87_9BACT|nr:MAG: hypothetical protein COW64_10270 [bacterium (Candidatus Blackallbacteria) CG18_big_fil_WC_8_21_14_2_50_49_26]PIW19428.1 MAG: hypothetical protein COW36_00905 [bacterium (Candidatus Blackallbacteria) CG17_big_fil_post_rev_8_21_14_2_50_48_46]PIW48968.1 MAG: hypothetical protein COW20_07550 [bacterium (Candidatus Blackallbacteria) CG13_big_fil_rev_8_21_14_2_50_49_14]